MSAQLQAIQGDITTMAVDAIVNAANTSLMGGGGVDGAIHRKAGRELVNECATLYGCRPGEAKITKGYNLPAKHVIHTVGPVWRDGTRGEVTTLDFCYRNSLQVARAHGLRTIAFPCISTGAYCYPPDKAAKVAVATVRAVTAEHPDAYDVITFCCFEESDLRLYEDLLLEA
jgi:O-acetyl-ADP-ribose deacetylase (regulator of RNase III)